MQKRFFEMHQCIILEWCNTTAELWKSVSLAGGLVIHLVVLLAEAEVDERSLNEVLPSNMTQTMCF